MKINRIIFLECLVYLSLIPFFIAVTYDLIVFYAVAEKSIIAGGGDALVLAVISAMTYCVTCIISVPSIIYILYVLKKRNLKIKIRIKILLGIIIGVIVFPPVYILIM